MNHTLYSFLILTLTASPLSVLAQRHKIYSPNIATLQAVADDKWQNMPLIQLGTNQVMNFAFDDLTHEYHRYMYRIEHCEADWTTSNEIFTSDYIDGFTEDNHRRLAQDFRNLESRSLMVIGKTPLTEELYGPFIRAEYSKTYAVNIRNRFKSESTHLVVTNF